MRGGEKGKVNAERRVMGKGRLVVGGVVGKGVWRKERRRENRRVMT